MTSADILSRCCRLLVTSAAWTLAAACTEGGVNAPFPTLPRGIAVLDGFVQPGLTMLADTGTASSRIVFGSPTEFDAPSMRYRNDTVVAVSSKGAGDLLYIADLASASVRKVQLPAGGNAAVARLVPGGNGNARVIVALRDSLLVATVDIPATGNATITRILDAGVCPIDAFRHENATWVVDANANCQSNYAVQGPVRLIRIPDDGSARDTVTLSGLVGSAAGAIVVGNEVFVSAGGDANFASFPFELNASGAIAKVDLVSRVVVETYALPTGSYDARMKRGLDGHLYVTFYENLDTFTDRVIELRPGDLTPVNTSGANPWRTFTEADSDATVTCAAATADALGRVHCLTLGAASATTLWVFDESGVEVRRVAAGQGGVDLVIRP